MEGDGKAAGLSRRWWLLALLFVATGLNYVDRQALSILAPTVQRDLDMDDAGYAAVVQLFLLAYTLSYLLSGRIVDRLGAKLSLALFVGWWSISNMMTGTVRNVAALGASRFSLGLGEAGVYLSAPKTASEWFRPSERAFAHGVYTAGAMVGATIAPPLIGFLAIAYGWRAAFLVTGAAGIGWLALWLLAYRNPTPDQSAALGIAPLGLPAPGGWPLWRGLLRDPAVWRLIGARVFADAVWYFYLFWFPKYLSDARGLTLAMLAATAWIVYLAADIGSIAGGLASGCLVERGAAPAASRQRLMKIAALTVPVGALLAFAPPLTATLTLAALVVFAHQVWQVNLGALIIDIVPGPRLATAFGLIAAGSGVGGILFTQVITATVTVASYKPLFLIMALFHPIAWLLARNVRALRPAADDAVPPTV